MKVESYNLEPIVRYERIKKNKPYLRFVKGGIYLSSETTKLASKYKYLQFYLDKEKKVFGIDFSNDKGPNSHIIPKMKTPSQKFISSIKTTDCLEDLMNWNLDEERYKVVLETNSKKENFYLAHLEQIEKKQKRKLAPRTKKATKVKLKDIEKVVNNKKESKTDNVPSKISKKNSLKKEETDKIKKKSVSNTKKTTEKITKKVDA